MTSATSVISQLMENIITSTPDDGGNRGDDLGQALVERLADSIHIIGDAREHLALVGAVKVTQRHAVDLFGDVLAEAVGDLHRDTGHDPALDVGKSR